MSKIAQAFDHGKAFIPFVTAGDPDLETTRRAIFWFCRKAAQI